MSSDDADAKAPRDGQSQVFGRATIGRNEILRHLAQGKESETSGITINDVQAYINKSINRKSKMILYRSAAVFGLILVIVQMFCTFGVAVWANETSRQVYVENGATNLTNASGTTLGTTIEASVDGGSLLDVHDKIADGDTLTYVGGVLPSQDVLSTRDLSFEVNVVGHIESAHWTDATGAMLNLAEVTALEAKITADEAQDLTHLKANSLQVPLEDDAGCEEEYCYAGQLYGAKSCYDMYTDVPDMKMIACEDSFTVVQGGRQYGVHAASRRRMGIMISKYGISTSSRGRPGGMRRWAFRYGWNGLRMPYRRPNLVAGELSCADISAAMSTETYDAGDLSHIDTSHMSQDAMDMGGRRRLAEDEAEGTRRRLMRMCGSGSSMGGHKVNAKATGNWYKAQEAFLGYSITDSSMYGRRVNAITVGVAAVNSSGGAPSTDEVQKYADKADALVTHNIPAIIEAAAENGRNAMHIDGMCVDCSAGGNNCIIANCS